MRDIPAPATRLARPAEILEVLRAKHRALKWESDFAHHVRDLTPDSNVDALRISLEESSSPKGLAKGLIRTLGLDMRPKDLAAWLVPMETRRLDELCALIAAKTEIPEIGPVTVMGCDSRAAGAFRFLRHALSLGGQSASFRPSTRLADCRLRRSLADRCVALLTLTAPRLGAKIKMAPSGRSVSTLAWTGAVISFAMIFVSAIALWIAGELADRHLIEPWPGIYFLPFLFTALVALSFTAGIFLGRFDWVVLAHRDCKTFGDLARAVAAYEPPASSE